MQYLVVIEQTTNNYSAYVPDLPGCIATGKTLDDVRQTIREAIQFHIDGLREEGMPVPAPVTQVDFVSVAAAA